MKGHENPRHDDLRRFSRLPHLPTTLPTYIHQQLWMILIQLKLMTVCLEIHVIQHPVELIMHPLPDGDHAACVVAVHVYVQYSPQI